MSVFKWIKEALDIVKSHSELNILKKKEFQDRINKIIEGLGSDKIEVRILSIHDFERIANDSKDAARILIEILPSFVKRRSSEQRDQIKSNKKFMLSEDIQLALTILGQIVWEEKWQEQGVYLNISNTQLFGANLSGANLFNASFDQVDLRNADFTKANCQYAKFKYTNLENADFDEANLQNSYFNNTILLRVNLNHANLQKAKCNSINLSDASMIEADLRGVFMSYSNLHKASLNNACLENAFLSKAILTETSLYECNLMGASLKGANLRHADFDGAKLDGANLMGANLLDSHCLTSDQLLKCKTLYGAKIDKAIRVSVKRKAPNLLERESAGELNSILDGWIIADI